MSRQLMKTITGSENLPLILALNKGGEPLGWIDYEKSAFYYAKGKVLWSLGKHDVLLRGGINAKTGLQSTLTMDTIIALDSGSFTRKNKTGKVSLSNMSLFSRDRHVCAYCGEHFSKHVLTRDHVIPRSQGGPDVWENVVASCKKCNNKKGGRTPEEAGMPLLYVPYAPTYNEHLILLNRRILADQMEFLLAGVSPHSRLHQDLLTKPQ